MPTRDFGQLILSPEPVRTGMVSWLLACAVVKVCTRATPRSSVDETLY